MKEKVLGITNSLSGKWEAMTNIKVQVENPVFSHYRNHEDEIYLIYLTKFYTIEEYNLKTGKKTTLITN